MLIKIVLRDAAILKNHISIFCILFYFICILYVCFISYMYIIHIYLINIFPPGEQQFLPTDRNMLQVNSPKYLLQLLICRTYVPIAIKAQQFSPLLVIINVTQISLSSWNG